MIPLAPDITYPLGHGFLSNQEVCASLNDIFWLFERGLFQHELDTTYDWNLLTTFEPRCVRSEAACGKPEAACGKPEAAFGKPEAAFGKPEASSGDEVDLDWLEMFLKEP